MVIDQESKLLHGAARDYAEPRCRPYNFKRPEAFIYLGREEDADVAIQLAIATQCRICTRS